MLWFIVLLFFFPLVGFAGFLLGPVVPRLRRFMPWAVVGGCLAGAGAAGSWLLSGRTWTLLRSWSVPGGSFSLGMDSLSSFFLFLVFLVGAASALTAVDYMEDDEPRSRDSFWFFFGLLISSMALVTAARNAVLFLVAWEIMALSSFFLVVHDDEKLSVRRAGWLYLAASHIGAAVLVVFFLLLGRGAHTLDFNAFPGPAAARAGTLFLLALAGFGMKAGLVPLHIWLPEAHSAAPSPVSGLMSGVMIKMGIYGLVRSLGFLGAPPAWWGAALLSVGAVSGVLGVLFALAQHDLKRLLAYHSVENIGIITMGIGAGLLGTSLGCPALAVLGWTGGLLHVLNHAVFKGLLFLSGGAAVRAAGTREMDRLGGLLKKMPWTGGCFLVGAAAISGLPPLNGFVSEFLIFLGLLGGFSLGGAAGPWLVAAVGSLALIAGLAAACFCKAFGTVFLGAARSDGAAKVSEAGGPTRASLATLAAICALVGFFPGRVLRAGAGIVRGVVPLPGGSVAAVLESAEKSLACVSFVALGLLGGVAVLGGFLLLLRRRRGAVSTVTWDCGYAFPGPRMQYTASSFAQPAMAFFGSLLRLRRSSSAAIGYFPEHASFHTEMPDPFREEVYRPLFVRLKETLFHGRRLQHGVLRFYVLYIVLALAAFLVWAMR